MIVIAATAHIVNGADPDRFYQMVQEDEALEWATFWAFLLAAGANVLAAIRLARGTRGLPWFVAGLGLFCFVVAMEEISWGQRVFGYRPPVYFLENNYQQEFNFHNVIESDFRQDIFVGLIAAYGCVLPLMMLIGPLARGIRRVGIIAPPTLLAPGFAVALGIYIDYPWRFAGEVVELIVGLGFLFAGGLCATQLATGAGKSRASGWRGGVRILLLLGVTLCLGVANAALSQVQRASSPEAVRAAERELEAMKNDFFAVAEQQDGLIPVRCGLHKRLYTFVESYDKRFLEHGEFAALTSQGLPDERAAFFIDPWNDPYWIRSRCSKDRSRRSVFLYSFGPNRRRDSNKWEHRPDDLGVYLIRTDEPSATAPR